MHPDENEPDDRQNPPQMKFWFLCWLGCPSHRLPVPVPGPADLNPDTVRFYAWTSATRDGAVIANDYAPDTGWITAP